MRYISTRHDATTQARPFSDILLEGLAPDGGLYLPEEYPQLSTSDLEELRETLQTKGYAALAAKIFALFIDDIPVEDLEGIAARAYSTPAFSTSEIVPVTRLESGTWIAHLSEGPTAAFKDMAMQLLGELFEYELGRRGDWLTIVGATSGDTGSSAEYALRGRPGLSVVMLTPAGRMTAFQRAQMFSLMDENIINVAVDGVFDDCQDLVKAVNMDADFKAAWHLGAVNSINWARLLAQVVYYIATWLRVTSARGAEGEIAPRPEDRATQDKRGTQEECSTREECSTAAAHTTPGESTTTAGHTTQEECSTAAGHPIQQDPSPQGDRVPSDERINVVVPSGNFGNVCAAHIARSMGLPLGALVVATNENDVLDEFFRTGVYRPRSCEQTLATSSPSMDISKASNFERFIFDLLGRDAERVSDLFGRALKEEGFFDLSGTEEFAHLRETYGFISGTSTHADRLEEIRRTEVEDAYLLDPHTADGMHVARSLAASLEGPLVVMETALPVKFAETILEATGHLPPVPERFEGIEGGQQRVIDLENEVGALKALIEARVRVDT